MPTSQTAGIMETMTDPHVSHEHANPPGGPGKPLTGQLEGPAAATQDRSRDAGRQAGGDGFELDEAQTRLFSYGACAGLAIALHELTGWTLIKVTDADAVYRPPHEWTGPYDMVDMTGFELDQRADVTNEAGTAGGLHWLVAHPQGWLLDVDGRHEPRDVVESYDDHADDGIAALGVATLTDALDEYVIAKGEPVPLTQFRRAAAAVLSREGLTYR